MAGLPAITWLRFFVWLVIGLIVYFFYSRKRSEFYRPAVACSFPPRPPLRRSSGLGTLASALTQNALGVDPRRRPSPADHRAPRRTAARQLRSPFAKPPRGASRSRRPAPLRLRLQRTASSSSASSTRTVTLLPWTSSEIVSSPPKPSSISFSPFPASILTFRSIAYTSRCFSRVRITQSRPCPSPPTPSCQSISIPLLPGPQHPSAYLLAASLWFTMVTTYLSHHRRFDLSRRFAESPRTAVNANLYAYDLMPTNEHGDLYLGRSVRQRELATVRQAHHRARRWRGRRSNRRSPRQRFPGNNHPLSPRLGRRRSERPREPRRPPPPRRTRELAACTCAPARSPIHAGDHVHRGQQLGEIGFSGDSLFPHLHYNVTAGDLYPSQGVPSYFRSFVRMLGGTRKAFNDREPGQIDTGDLVESTGSCSLAQQRYRGADQAARRRRPLIR